MDDIGVLANVIYGEAANQPSDVMEMVGSTLLNRLEAGKKEFGYSLPEVAEKGYYAVKNKNTPYTQALLQKFPDKKSETAYKQAYAIAAGLYKGTIQRKEGQFFFTEKEKPKMNWKLLKETGNVGPYRVWAYK